MSVLKTVDGVVPVVLVLHRLAHWFVYKIFESVVFLPSLVLAVRDCKLFVLSLLEI